MDEKFLLMIADMYEKANRALEDMSKSLKEMSQALSNSTNPLPRYRDFEVISDDKRKRSNISATKQSLKELHEGITNPNKPNYYNTMNIKPEEFAPIGSDNHEDRLQRELHDLEDSEEVCEYCGGSGEISTDESDGEGHIQRGVGTRKCICQIKETEYEPE